MIVEFALIAVLSGVWKPDIQSLGGMEAQLHNGEGAYRGERAVFLAAGSAQLCLPANRPRKL